MRRHTSHLSRSPVAFAIVLLGTFAVLAAFVLSLIRAAIELAQ
jgi:hypothetical protein